jgi:peptidoglycan hydrolase-like protein with peptidoglycan-binding domain
MIISESEKNRIRNMHTVYKNTHGTGIFLREDATPKPTLRQGSKGEDVKLLQTKIGVDDDGIFGPQTKKAVQKFQTDNKLSPDGVVGKNTWAVINKSAPAKVETPKPQEKEQPVDKKEFKQTSDDTIAKEKEEFKQAKDDKKQGVKDINYEKRADKKHAKGKLTHREKKEARLKGKYEKAGGDPNDLNENFYNWNNGSFILNEQDDLKAWFNNIFDFQTYLMDNGLNPNFEGHGQDHGANYIKLGDSPEGFINEYGEGTRLALLRVGIHTDGFNIQPGGDLPESLTFGETKLPDFDSALKFINDKLSTVGPPETDGDEWLADDDDISNLSKSECLDMGYAWSNSRKNKNGEWGVCSMKPSDEPQEDVASDEETSWCKKQLEEDWYWDTLVTGRGYLNVYYCGDAIVIAQEMLNKFLGLKGETLIVVDGAYGPSTKAAIKKIQSLIGVKSDGLYGEKTHNALVNSIKLLEDGGDVTNQEEIVNIEEKPDPNTEKAIKDELSKKAKRIKKKYDKVGKTGKEKREIGKEFRQDRKKTRLKKKYENSLNEDFYRLTNYRL